MHGSIINLLKRFVQTQYDHSTWLKLVELSGLHSADFDMNEVYPDEHIYALVAQAAEMTGIPAVQLQEKFGEFLVPDLMLVYKRYVQPGWGTLEMIENTEEAMHGAVRRDAPVRAPLFCTSRGFRPGNWKSPTNRSAAWGPWPWVSSGGWPFISTKPTK